MQGEFGGSIKPSLGHFMSDQPPKNNTRISLNLVWRCLYGEVFINSQPHQILS